MISFCPHIYTGVCLKISNIQEPSAEKFKWIFLEKKQKDEQYFANVNSVLHNAGINIL